MATINQGEMFKFLDELQATGVTNMFGAGDHLRDEYGINKQEAKETVLAWMKAKS
jgi:hypothetical protein